MPPDGCERSRFGERADATHCLYAFRTGWRFDARELFRRNGLDGEAKFARKRDQNGCISLVAGGRQRVEPAGAAGRNQRFAQRIDVCFSSKAEAGDLHFTALHCTTGRTASQDLKSPSGAAWAISTRISSPPRRRCNSCSSASVSSVTACATKRVHLGTSDQTASNITPSRPPPKNTACGGASPRNTSGACPTATSILSAKPKDTALARILAARSSRCSIATAVASLSAHSTETEPEPAPISHNRSPALGASAD